jgi:hypothetical protein
VGAKQISQRLPSFPSERNSVKYRGTHVEGQRQKEKRQRGK